MIMPLDQSTRIRGRDAPGRTAPPGEDDRKVFESAARRGVEAPAVSLYGASPDGRGGLLLGYAVVEEAGIREGVRRMTEALG